MADRWRSAYDYAVEVARIAGEGGAVGCSRQEVGPRLHFVPIWTRAGSEESRREPD